MAAINRGIEEATGDLVVDCDSDDYFTEDAFKIIEENSSKLLKNNEIYAMKIVNLGDLDNPNAIRLSINEAKFLRHVLKI